MAGQVSDLTARQVVRQVKYTGYPQSCIDEIIAEFGDEPFSFRDIQRKLDEREQGGESYRDPAISYLEPVSESDYKGGTLSGSFEYVGGYSASASPSHGTVDIFHAPYWSGSVVGALEAQNVSPGNVLYFAGCKTATMSFPNSGSVANQVISASQLNTTGLYGKVVYSGGGFSSSKWITGAFPSAYSSSGNFTSTDERAFSGSYFTGSVVVGNCGALNKCNFSTGILTGSWKDVDGMQSNDITSAFSSNPATTLSASVEVAWNMGETKTSGNPSEPVVPHRTAYLGGDFDMSGSMFDDSDLAALFKLQRGVLFVIKTTASGSIVSSPDGSRVDRSTKKDNTGEYRLKNYFSERNAVAYTKTVKAGSKQSKYAVQKSKDDALATLQSKYSTNAATASAREFTIEDMGGLV